MKIFVDSANLLEIEEALSRGFPFAQVTVDSEASEARPAPLRVPWTQPKVDEIVEQDLGLPVAEVGSGYVLFDLRLLRTRIRPGAQPTRDGRYS